MNTTNEATFWNRYTLAMLAVSLFFLIAPCALCADITLTWDAPTNNVDGTPVIDLAGYRLESAQLYCAYTEVNKVITKTVLATGEWQSVWCPTNRVTLTLPSTLYIFRACAVSTWGAASDWSSNCTERVGAITTIKLVKATK